jgi:hypothetical protein
MMSWAAHAGGVGKAKNIYTEIWWGTLKGDHLEDLGVDGRIILKRI